MKYLITMLAFFSLLAFSSVNDTNYLAKVNQFNGVYVYIDSKPVDDYKIVGVEKARVGITGVSYPDIRSKLIDKVKKTYPHAEGVILRMGSSGSLSYADAIVFNK